MLSLDDEYEESKSAASSTGNFGVPQKPVQFAPFRANKPNNLAPTTSPKGVLKNPLDIKTAPTKFTSREDNDAKKSSTKSKKFMAEDELIILQKPDSRDEMPSAGHRNNLYDDIQRSKMKDDRKVIKKLNRRQRKK